jgi:hypothetical protein
MSKGHYLPKSDKFLIPLLLLPLLVLIWQTNLNNLAFIPAAVFGAPQNLLWKQEVF